MRQRVRIVCGEDRKDESSDMVWVKRFIIFLVVGFFLFYLIAQPEAAANAVRNLFQALARVFQHDHHVLPVTGWLAVGVLSWLDPHVDQYISSTADEQKVLEVRKHWAASFWAYVRLAIAVVIFISGFAYQAPVYYVFVVIGLGIGLQALWRILEEYRDRFVITNQRVFRVNGVLSIAPACRC